MLDYAGHYNLPLLEKTKRLRLRFDPVATAPVLTLASQRSNLNPIPVTFSHGLVSPRSTAEYGPARAAGKSGGIKINIHANTAARFTG